MTNELHLIDLTMRNFLSYGNSDTVINLDDPGTTLIMGKDLDSGTGTCNGVGKSSILRGIVYALFDDPMSKDTKLDELINNVNKKNMMVTIRFTQGGDEYKVIRQRKGKDGNTVHLYKNDSLITLDSVDNTNKYIAEKIIGYSMELFVRIVVFSAGHGAFFSLPTSGAKKPTQSDIIEELFDLTSLTTKANLAKAEIKENEQRMEVIKAKIEQIEKEKIRHELQVTTTKQRINTWDVQHTEKIERFKTDLAELKHINFEQQEQLLKDLESTFAQFKELSSSWKRSIDWATLHNQKLVDATTKLKELGGINFDEQIAIHYQLVSLNKHKQTILSLTERASTWEVARASKINKINEELQKVADIDFDQQETWLEEQDIFSTHLITLSTSLVQFNKVKQDSTKKLDALKVESTHLFDATCPYCLQHFASADTKIDKIKSELVELENAISQADDDIASTNNKIVSTQGSISSYNDLIKVKSLAQLAKMKADKVGAMNRLFELLQDPNPHSSELQDLLQGDSNDIAYLEQLTTDAVAVINEKTQLLNQNITGNHSVQHLEQMKMEQIQLTQKVTALNDDVNPFYELIGELVDKNLYPDISLVDVYATKLDSTAQKISYIESRIIVDNIESLMSMMNRCTNAEDGLQELDKETNPHLDTLKDLLTMDLDQAEYSAINEYTKLVEHQKFLVKLLTKSDSFVRKALIEENIPFLNKRLKLYLTELGLPHKVEFTNTMTAAISQLGRELSFHMLSTGQKARVNLALSWAFRDVLQDMHGRVNFCLLDEVLDVGLCSIGIGAAIRMLKNRASAEKMTMFVISHRDEVDGVFDKTMKVEMKNGFSRIAE